MAGTTHYKYEFKADSGTLWQVRIVDTTYAGTDHITLHPDGSGFGINWEGASDGEYVPIIPATVTLNLIIDANVRALLAAILAGTDSQFVVIISKFVGAAYTRYWRGPVLNDGMMKPDAANGVDRITIKATDGFGLLRDMEYENFTISALQRGSFLGFIFQCIKKLVPATAYESDANIKMISTASVWYEDTMDSSVLTDWRIGDPIANTLTNESAYITVDDYGVARGKSYYEILEAILRSCNLQISQWNGTFLIIQSNTYAQAQTRAWNYDWEEGIIDTELIDLQATLDRFTGGLFNYILPVKQVTTEYEYRQGIYANNLLPYNVDEGATYQLGDSSQGADMTISGAMSTIVTSDTASNGEFLAIYQLSIICGTYYALRSGGAFIWSLTPGYILIRDTASVFGTIVGSVESISNFTIKLPPLPDEGVALSFRWEFKQFEVMTIPGTAVTIPGTNTYTYDDIEGSFRASIDTGVPMEGSMLYKASVSNGAKASYELENSTLGDGANKYSAGALFVENAGNVTESNVWSIYSDIGVLTMPLNSLRCKEWLAWRRNTVVTFEFEANGEPNFHKGFVLDSVKYMITSMDYNCSYNRYSGTAVQIVPLRTSITIDTPLTSQEQNTSSSGGLGSSAVSIVNVPYPLLNDILEYRDNAYKPYVNKKATLPAFPYFYINGNYPTNDEQILQLDAQFTAQNVSVVDADQSSGTYIGAAIISRYKLVGSDRFALIMTSITTGESYIYATKGNLSGTKSSPIIIGSYVASGTDFYGQHIKIDDQNKTFTINLDNVLFPLISAKTTPVDADSLLLIDSADSSRTKKLTWANVKSFLNFWTRDTINGKLTPSTITDQIINENIIKSKDATGDIYTSIDRGSLNQQSNDSILYGLNYISSTELTSGTNIFNRLVQFVKSSTYYPQFKEIVNAAENWTTSSRAIEWILQTVVSGATTLSQRLKIDKDGYFKIGSTTNYTQFSPSGHQQMVGDATVFDDMTVPGLAIRTQGTNDPILTAVGGSTLIYAFSGSLMNEVFFTVQLPHSYKEGSAILPHVHWCPMTSPATTKNVLWKLDYQWQNAAGVFTATDTTISVTAPTGTIGFTHIISDMPDISGTGKTMSSILICRLYRVPTDAADTYDASLAGLLAFDFRIEKDSIGSNEEYSK